MYNNSSGDNSTDDWIDNHNYTRISRIVMLQYSLIALCVVGLPGNFLTILTIFKLKGLNSATFLLIYLEVINGLALVIKLITYNLYNSCARLYCGFFLIPAMSVGSVAYWAHVLVCAERFISMFYPLKRNDLLTMKRVKIYASIMPLAATLTIVIYFQIFLQVDEPGCKVVYLSIQWFVVLLNIMSFYITLVFVLILTIKVIIQLNNRSLWWPCKRRDGCHDRDLRENSQRNVGSRQHYEKILSILMVTSSMVCVAPNVFGYICYFFATFDSSYTVGVELNFFLHDCQYAFNFYLYIGLCVEFRGKVITIFRSL